MAGPRYEHTPANASVKFVAPGVQPHVEVRAARDGERWRFTVEDNGTLPVRDENR